MLLANNCNETHEATRWGGGKKEGKGLIRKRERTDVIGKGTGKSSDGECDADAVCACARMPKLNSSVSLIKNQIHNNLV